MIDLSANFDGIVAFTAVATSGSFTAAAERLGKTKASVSAQVKRLEMNLGVSLLARTTRRVRLTTEGEVLYRAATPALKALDNSLAAAGNERAGLTGTLRITAPIDPAVQSLAPALAAFSRQHPGLQLELHTADRVIDLVAEGIDLALRFGALRDSSLRALKLGEFEQHVVASPAYLKRHGVPQTPADLAEHQWICFSLLRSPLTWTFYKKKEVKTVRMNARIRVDSSAALRSLLIQGAGISVLDNLSVAEAVSKKNLVRVLPDWSIAKGGIYAVLPPGRHAPASVRAFIDFYRESLGSTAT